MSPGGPVRRRVSVLLTAVLVAAVPALGATAAPGATTSSGLVAAKAAAKQQKPVTRTARFVVVQRSRVAIDLRTQASIRKVRVVKGLPRNMVVRHGVLRGLARKGRTVIRVRGISTLQGERNRRLRLKVVVVGRKPVAVKGTSLLTRGPGGRPGNAASYAPMASADGSTVAFLSRATNLLASPLPPMTGFEARVFVWDRTTGRTELVSVAPDGTARTGNVMDISDDGSRVLVRSGSSLLLRDRTSATTREVATDAQAADLSGDGTLITWSKDGRTTRVDLASGTSVDLGVPAFTAVSPNGRYLAARDGERSYIWDTTSRTVVRETHFGAPELSCFWTMGALTDDAARGTVSAGCDRAVATSVVDTVSMTSLAGASILDANAAATWAVMANHRGSVWMSAVPGDPRVLSRQPARVRTSGPVYYSPAVAVAGEGDTAVWSVQGGNVVRDAYTPYSQIYIWTSGR